MAVAGLYNNLYTLGMKLAGKLGGEQTQQCQATWPQSHFCHCLFLIWKLLGRKTEKNISETWVKDEETITKRNAQKKEKLPIVLESRFSPPRLQIMKLGDTENYCIFSFKSLLLRILLSTFNNDWSVYHSLSHWNFDEYFKTQLLL